jgi:cytochrome c peroxidase
MHAALIAMALISAEPAPTPIDNPLTVEKAALGRKLFFDPRLSVNSTVSCSSCHEPQRGWTDNRRVSVGVFGRQGTRNAPTIVNAAYDTLMFRDGRATMLEGQALLPLTNNSEMDNDSLDQVVNRLNATGYRQEFELAFGTPVTAQGIAMALASFQRTVTVHDAPIDKFLEGRTWEMTRKQKAGFAIFQRSGCTNCHKTPDFRDGLFHNTGTSVNERDQGRFTITDNAADFDAFKTPTLREVGRTAPYFHSGRAASLRDVVDHYDRGGVANNNLDPRIRPLGLSAADKDLLVEFLRTGFNSTSGAAITAPALPH